MIYNGAAINCIKRAAEKSAGDGTTDRAWSVPSMNAYEPDGYQTDVEPPYQDKSLLYELYHREGLTKKDIGELLGCSDVTIHNWMDQLGIPDTRAWEWPCVVRHLYVDERLPLAEVGDILDCAATSVTRTLKEAGIDRRDAGDYSHPSIYFSQDGYLTCRRRVGDERYAFRVHRLVAVAEHGFDAVADNVVHHKNNHRADNRPDNLEILDPSEHVELHHKQGDILGN